MASLKEGFNNMLGGTSFIAGVTGLPNNILGGKNEIGGDKPHDFGPKKTFAEGKAMAEDILGPEGLKSKEMADIMQRRKQALEGMDAKEIEGLRSSMTQQQQAQAQQAQSRMSGQLGGARGGRAAMQQQNLMSQAMAGRMGIERDIMLQNEQVKREALDKYEGTTRFDVGQSAKEKEFKATLGMGFEGIQSQIDAAQISAAATRDMKPKDRGLVGNILGTVGLGGVSDSLSSVPIIGGLFG